MNDELNLEEVMKLINKKALKLSHIRKQIKALQDAEKLLSAELVKDVETYGEAVETKSDKYVNKELKSGRAVIKLQHSATIKFGVGMMNALKDKGLNEYIIESLDDKKLKERINSDTTFAKDWADNYSVTIADKISIEK